jgi:glycosyltransferase involved in cell wall biosynthesis
MPRKIAFFMHSFEEGGAQRTAITLAGCLAARGLDVELVVVDERGPLRESVAPLVTVCAIGNWLTQLPGIRTVRRWHMHAAIAPLARYLREVHPDVLVSAANHASLTSAAAHCWAAQKDIALALRVSNALVSRKRSGLKLISMVWTVRRADVVITITQALAAEVRQLAGDHAVTIQTVVNPVLDPARFSVACSVPPPWQDDGIPVIVGLGRLVPHKDFATLIRAFALLATRRSARLVILGEGPQRAELQALVTSLDLGGVVALPGWSTNPVPALRAASVFVLASQWEGLPGNLIEAMACGCAVVSTDCPGSRELLMDGDLGALVPVGDDASMAAAIEQALDHPPDPTRLRARAATYEPGLATDGFIQALRLACSARVSRRTQG